MLDPILRILVLEILEIANKGQYFSKSRVFTKPPKGEGF